MIIIIKMRHVYALHNDIAGGYREGMGSWGVHITFVYVCCYFTKSISASRQDRNDTCARLERRVRRRIITFFARPTKTNTRRNGGFYYFTTWRGTIRRRWRFIRHAYTNQTMVFFFFFYRYNIFCHRLSFCCVPCVSYAPPRRNACIDLM